MSRYSMKFESNVNDLTKAAERRPYPMGVAGMLVAVAAAWAVGTNHGDMPVWSEVLLGIVIPGYIVFGCHMLHSYGVLRGTKLQRDIDRLVEQDRRDDPLD